jgi:protein O-GlcNAc transferase
MISELMSKPSPTSLLLRAQAALGAGDTVTAGDLCRRQLLKSPADTEARYLLGLALALRGDHAGAIAQWEQLLRTAPRHFPTLANLGVALLQQGRPAQGASNLRLALAIDDRHAQLHYSLGNALLAREEYAAAADAFRAALERDPTLVDAWNNLGVCLRLAEQLPEAAAAFRRVLQLSPGYTTARENLADVQYAHAVALHRVGELERAVEAYDQAIAELPERIAPRRDRASALESLHRLDEALAGYRDAVARVPDTGALAGLLSCATRTCEWRAMSEALHELRDQPRGILAVHPFLSLSTCAEPSEQRAIAVARAAHLLQQTGLQQEDLAAQGRRIRRNTPGDKLRIAYVSSDLRDHAVAHLLVGVLEHHDRACFEVHAVSLQPADTDSAIGRRLTGAVAHFHDVSSLCDADAARLMRDAGIDIALDLNGHTIGGRPGIFAHRAAPTQANYLGYAGTSGAEWMDWIVADGIVIPPGAESGYTEQVLRLPQCYLPNDSRRYIGGVPIRTAAGLPETGFVFCAFTNAYKISSQMWDIWMRVLQGTPGSILWLRTMGPEPTRNLLQAARMGGIDPSRLVFAPHVDSMADHLARLSLADLYLDTLPYNAHSTTCDALWAGVPVLTWCGRTFAGRVAASALTTAGLPQLIAADPAAYESRALALARDPNLHAGLRQAVQVARQSALFDTAGYTRDLETAFRQMQVAVSE